MGVQAQAFQHHTVVMGDQQLPFVARWYIAKRVIQGKVDPVLVGTHKPGPLPLVQPMVNAVVVAFDPGCQAVESPLRVIGIQHPAFAGGFAVKQQDQLALGARTIAMQEKTPVRLMKHFMRSGFAQGMAPQFVRTMGLVQFCEKQGLAVVGPGHAAIAVGERQLADCAAAQLLDEQAVGFFAAGIQAVGQTLLIWADAEGAQGNKAAIGEGVRVQQ